MVLAEETAANLGITGVVIDRVMPESSAHRAGLEGIDYRNRLLGDIILAVDDNEVTDIDDFVQRMQKYEIGQTVRLKVRRGDTVRDVVVKVMDIS